MVKFINRLTNTPMMVADDRVEEYKAAGHILAADAPAVEPSEDEEPKAKKPKKPATKKTTTKKR